MHNFDIQFKGLVAFIYSVPGEKRCINVTYTPSGR